MKTSKQWSRRAFVQGMGYASALGAVGAVVPWKAAAEAGQPAADSAAGFAYIASSGPGTDNGASGIHVFDVRGDVRGNRWTWKQSLASRSPVFLALHPNRQFLYAVNEVDEHQGLPCGTVESYRIDAHDGRLALINRQPLSLSATRPRHLAISPDGSHLVVAVHGGGAYNVLPIEASGEVGRVTGIFKETGAGPHPEHQASAHPHTAVFDKAGRYFLATDQGCDRLSVFTLQDGQIARSHQSFLRPGSGPGHIAIHPSSALLYVSNALDGSIAGYRLREDTGEIEREIGAVCASTVKPDRAWSQNAIVIPPSGEFLYASGSLSTTRGHSAGIAAWKINIATGGLSHLQTWSGGSGSLHTLVATPDGQGLLATDNSRGSVLHIGIDSGSGKLGGASTLAGVATPTSLVMKYL